MLIFAFLFLIASTHYISCEYVINPDIVIKNVDRNIDMSSQIVKIQYKYTVTNMGDNIIKSLALSTDAEFKKHMAYISAQSGEMLKTPLSISEIKTIKKSAPTGGSAAIGGKILWKVELKEYLVKGKLVNIDIEIFLTKHLNPFPTSIGQKDKQFVLYHGNAYVYSPYLIQNQKTFIHLGTINIENFTPINPTSQVEQTITYGPYENIAPYSKANITIHYENNAPFLVVTKLVRQVEVSHWGNIAVEESISLKHEGAKLKGPFSRYDYQRDSAHGIKSFKTILPAAASDAYYRDEIGNISTSNIRDVADFIELDLRPRFPLFGGWRTQYILGYNVPSYEYLFHSSKHFVLRMRFIDHIFDNMVIDEAFVKIILPENVYNIRVHVPYNVLRHSNTYHKTYLDTVGRPVLMLSKKNLIENHIQDLELEYMFIQTFMLKEPLLTVFVFYLFFILVIVYIRIDFSITRPTPPLHPRYKNMVAE
uniref:Dolichyl-diphosphooligosaccharide--protein glycosyltransferase subunit 1 n=2 Tax=Cacopsylla melanoneura TaxID=428564 RepID=A0A8D8WKG3_9HEMI